MEKFVPEHNGFKIINRPPRHEMGSEGSDSNGFFSNEIWIDDSDGLFGGGRFDPPSEDPEAMKIAASEFEKWLEIEAITNQSYKNKLTELRNLYRMMGRLTFCCPKIYNDHASVVAKWIYEHK